MNMHEYRDCPMFAEHPSWGLCRAARYTGSICFCTALNETDFGYDCPFYKTVDQYEADELRTISKEKPYIPKRPAKMVFKLKTAKK